MSKFWILLKKELRELLTPLMIVPILLTIVIFFGIGKLGAREAEKTKRPQPIMIVDQDHSALSKRIADTLGEGNFTLIPPTDDPLQGTLDHNGIAYVVIPEGFQKEINGGQQQTIELHSVLRSLSMQTSARQAQIQAIVQSLSTATSAELIATKTTLDPTFVKQPIKTNDFVAVGTRQAKVSLSEVMGFIQSQTYFIPLIVFLVIVFASQLIATSIASEKENKTLETLLSTPVSRQAIISAKLVAAGLLALAFSVVYMVAFRSYIGGIVGGQTVQFASTANTSSAALVSLGLKFGIREYILLGTSLFGGIMAGLSLALILGVFAEDVKSIQGIITPLMILLVIPYFMITFFDFSSLSSALKWLIYAIPFSHPFLAVGFISLHQYWQVVWGILYQLGFVVLFVWVAGRIFSTDRIMTLKLRLKKRT